MAAYVVLLTELLAERGTHDSATDAGRGIEVRLARLAPRRVQGCCNLLIPSSSNHIQLAGGAHSC